MAFRVPERYRLTPQIMAKSGMPMTLASIEQDGNNGVFMFNTPLPGRVRYARKRIQAICIASDGFGWEHVSVRLSMTSNSRFSRLPTWEEMCYVKGMFWDAEDAVVQIHPPESSYVNCHPSVLHLWRPIGVVLPLPDPMMVGPITNPGD